MKKRKAPLLMTILILILFHVFYILNMEGRPVNAKGMEEKEQHTDAIKMTVILERMYIDGEISQESIVETIWSRENFWAKYDDWQLIQMEKDRIVFRRQVDDISPLLKANGYFGITAEGVFTIFNGRPKQSKIIQSFFQIDLGRLESKKWEELRKGIPITTKEQYVEVIDTLKIYSKMEKN